MNYMNESSSNFKRLRSFKYLCELNGWVGCLGIRWKPQPEARVETLNLFQKVFSCSFQLLDSLAPTSLRTDSHLNHKLLGDRWNHLQYSPAPDPLDSCLLDGWEVLKNDSFTTWESLQESSASSLCQSCSSWSMNTSPPSRSLVSVLFTSSFGSSSTTSDRTSNGLRSIKVTTKCAEK